TAQAGVLLRAHRVVRAEEVVDRDGRANHDRREHQQSAEDLPAEGDQPPGGLALACRLAVRFPRGRWHYLAGGSRLALTRVRGAGLLDGSAGRLHRWCRKRRPGLLGGRRDQTLLLGLLELLEPLELLE